MREDNQNNVKNKTQSGSIIIWIFIAVLLFAALGFAFNSSNRSSTSFITDTQADALGSQVISIFNDHAQAIKRLRLNGCPKEQISFEGADTVFGVGYGNLYSAPTKCWVFEDEGGQLTYRDAPEAVLDSSLSASQNYGEVVYNRNLNLEVVGDNASGSLIILIPYVTEPVCSAINRNLYNTDSIPISNAGAQISLFAFRGDGAGSGVYHRCDTSHLGNDDCGAKMGCFNISAVNTNYAYYYVFTQN